MVNGEYYMYIHTAEDDEIQLHLQSLGPDEKTIESFKIIDHPEKVAVGEEFTAAELFYSEDFDYVLFEL